MGKPYSVVRFIKYSPFKVANNEVVQSGVIHFKLEVITPLHIGSGMQFLDEQTDKARIYSAFYRWHDKCAIPGSTLKGCIRQVAESISHSCLSGGGVKDKEKGREKFYTTRVNKKEDSGKCIVCDMFGSMGVKSKITVSQLVAEKGEPYVELFHSFKQPHITQSMLEDGQLIGYKFYHHGKVSALEKGKIPFEVMPIGSIFKGKIHYKNLTREQLQLLCFAMGFSGDIALKLGYGKPAYFGSVRLIAEDEKYVHLAKEYKMHDDQEIQHAIKELCAILDYKNAKEKSEWNEDHTY